MAIDTTRDFNLTRNQIIERALRKVGALSPEETISAEQIQTGSQALNVLVKAWQTKNVFLWTVVPDSILTVIDDVDYTLDSDVIGIDQAWYVENDNNIPMEIVPYREYKNIVMQTGTSNWPNTVALGHETQSPTLYLYPKPSVANVTVGFLAIVQLQDMDTAAGTADIPQRFIKALIYGLAADIADDYGLPLKERGYLTDKAEEAFSYAKRSDREERTTYVVASAFPCRRR